MKAYIYHVPELETYWLSTDEPAAQAGLEEAFTEVYIDSKLVRRIIKAQQNWNGIQKSLEEVFMLSAQNAGAERQNGGEGE